MRQGQQNNKRMRGRNRKGPNPLTRSYESNGPDVKIRGTALHIAEKYVQLARDAQASGDRVAAESYLQHAEHYYRIVAAAQAQMPQPQPVFRSDEEGDDDEERTDRVNGNGSDFGNERQPFAGGPAPSFIAEAQPYLNGQGQLEDERPEPNEDNRFEPREGFGDAAAYGREGQNEPRQFRPRQGGDRGFQPRRPGRRAPGIQSGRRWRPPGRWSLSRAPPAALPRTLQRWRAA